MLTKPTIVCDYCQTQLAVLDKPEPPKPSSWSDDTGWYELRKPLYGENAREAHFCNKKCLELWLEEPTF